MGELMPLPGGLGAKYAVEVAAVGYFKIATGDHEFLRLEGSEVLGFEVLRLRCSEVLRL